MSSKLQQLQSGLKSKQPKKLSEEKLRLLLENKRSLMHVFGHAELLYRSLKRTTILRWSKAIVSKKFKESRAGYRIKGRILIACTKCEPNLSLQQALIRWKVRSDAQIMKSAILRFALYSKINDFTALARLKNIVPPVRQQDKIRKRMNRRRAGIYFALMTERLVLNSKRVPWDDFKDLIRRPSGQSLGMILSVIHHKEMKKLLTTKFKHWLMRAKLESVRLLTVRKQLIRLFRVYDQQCLNAEQTSLVKAINLWKEANIKNKIRKKFFQVLLRTTYGRINRGYSKWINLPSQRELQKKRTGVFLLSSMRKMTRRTHQMSFQILKTLNEKANVKKNQIIQALLKNSFNKSYQSFYNWANYNTFYKMTRQIISKTDSIQGLVDQKKKSNVTRLKYVLERFYGNQSVHFIQRKFMLRLLSTTFGQGLSSFQKWKNLPDPARARLKQNSLQMLAKFQSFLKHKLRGVLISFQDINIEGQQKKKLCVKNLIWKASGKQFRMFHEWKKINQKYISTLSQLKTFNFFETLNKEIKGGFGILFQKENKLVNNVFKRMLGSYYNRLKFLFNEWRNKAHVLSIRQQINNQQISLLINGLNKFNKQSREHLLREVLYKFDRSRGLAKVIQLVNLKIMKTVHGQYLRSFQEWKSLPGSKEKYGRVSVFSNRLMKFSRKYLKRRSWNYLTDIQYEGENKMKKVVNYLMWITSSDLSKAFHKWAMITERSKVVEEFTRQRGIIHDELVRQKLLAFFNIGVNFRRDQLRDVLNKFALGTNENEKIRRFHLRLLQTVTGSVLLSFKIWKNLPPRLFQEQVAKASKFENKLANLINTTLKYSLTTLQDQYLEGVARKKRAVLLLFKKQESTVAKALHSWYDQIQLIKDTLRCKSLIQFLESLTQVISDNGIPFQKWNNQNELRNQALVNQFNKQLLTFARKVVNRNSIDIFRSLAKDGNKKMKRAATMMLINTLGNYKKAFLLLQSNVNSTRLLQANIQQVDDITRNKIVAWLNAGNKLRNSQLAQILIKFAENAKKAGWKQRIFFRLRQTTYGEVMDGFNRWKSLPKRKNLDLIQRAGEFERKMLRVCQKELKWAYEPLIEIHEDALSKKKRAVLLLFKQQESGVKKSLHLWKSQVDIIREAVRCKNLVGLFENLNQTVKVLFTPLMENTQQYALKMKTSEKLFANLLMNVHHAFTFWRNLTNTLNVKEKLENTLDETKKKNLIDSLQKYSFNNQHQNLRDILHRFATNKNIQTIRKRFFTKVFATTAGQVVNSFSGWRNLPVPKNYEQMRRANQFEKKIFCIFNRSLKNSFDPLKDVYYDGQNKQQQALRQMILITQSSQKRMFQSWVNYNQTVKSVLRCKFTTKMFQGIQNHVQNGVRIIFESQKDYEHKKKIFQQNFQQRILQCIMSQFSNSFHKWRNLPERTDLARASKFEASLLKATLRIIKRNSFDPLLDLQYEGQSKQKRSVNVILINTMGDFKRSFIKWHNYCINQRVVDHFTQENLRLCDEITRAKILAWLERNNIYKQRQLTMVLNKFNLNSKRGNWVQRIYSKLSHTKFGNVFTSFNIWRSLPVPLDKEVIAKAGQFERRLIKIVGQPLRDSFESFKDNYLEGVSRKKRAVLLLIKRQEGANKHAFLLWYQQIQRIREALRCKQLVSAFKNLDKYICASAQPFFETQAQSNLKEKIIIKLMANLSTNLEHGFRTWRDYANKCRVHDQIDSQTKQYLIDSLQRVLLFNKVTNLREVLWKFQRMRHITNYKNMFFRKILQTTAGQGVSSFRTWKDLPPKPDMDKINTANKFERNITRFIKHTIKKTIDSMQDTYAQGLDRQRTCIRQMVYLTQSANRRLFDQWKNYNKQVKQIEACKQTTKAFTNLNSILIGNIRILLQSKRDETIKQSVIQRIFDQQKHKLRGAFFILNSFSKIENIRNELNDQNRGIILENLEKFLKRNKNSGLKRILLGFYHNAQQKNLIKQIFLNMMSTKAGQTLDTFNRWRNIPDPKGINQKNSKSIGFHQQMLKLTMRRFRQMGYSPIEDLNYDAQAKKKQVINKLFYMIKSEVQKKFLLWHKSANEQTLQQKAKYTISLFQSLHHSTQSDLNPIFMEAHSNRQKIEALKNIIDKFEVQFKDSFNNWKETKEKLELINEKLLNEQKERRLLDQESIMKQLLNWRLKFVLGKFRREARDKFIIKKFYQVLYATAAGGVIDSFNRWKTLPVPVNKEQIYKANKFSLNLFNLFKKKLRNNSWDQLSEIQEEAQRVKNRYGNLIFRTAEGGVRRHFKHWRDTNLISKERERNQKVNYLIDILNTKISKELAFTFVDDYSHRKQMVAQLFNLSKLNQMSMAFMIWHKKCCRYNQKDRILNQFAISSQYMQKQLGRRFAHWRSLVQSQRLINKVVAIQKILKLDLIYSRNLKKKAIDTWRPPHNQNPWFKRVAQQIVKNSRLNLQLSYWRMRDSAFSKKKSDSKTFKTIKVKKFINVFQKIYEKTLVQSFIQIENFAKGEGNPSFHQSRISNVMSTPGKSQLASLFPQQKYTSNVIALEKLKFVFQKNEQRNLTYFFQQLSKKLEVERHLSTMSSEITSIRGLMIELDGEKRNKEEELIAANKTIEHLNKRLTYMLTLKFIQQINQVEDNLIYSAFEAIKNIGESEK